MDTSTGKEHYRHMLEDPRWQRKRLEIMQAAGWACEICGDAAETLNVHHRLYDNCAKGPWDYPDFSLMCLCRTCHAIWHIDQKKLESYRLWQEEQRIEDLASRKRAGACMRRALERATAHKEATP